MNHKQKLGYTLLGAGIMAVGIIIGQVITLNIEAQSNGVFNKITCRELEVVDENGNKAIVLFSVDNTNNVRVYDRQGKAAIHLGSSETGNDVLVVDETGESGILFGASKKMGNYLLIPNPTGKTAVEIIAHKQGNYIECSQLTVVDKSGKPAIELSIDDDANLIKIYDKAGKRALLMIANKGDIFNNGLYIYDQTQKSAVSINSIETNNEGSHNGIWIDYEGERHIALASGEPAAIVIYDKQGKAVWSAR